MDSQITYCGDSEWGYCHAIDSDYNTALATSISNLYPSAPPWPCGRLKEFTSEG